jgi:predicted DNA-binding WGR domain protein
MVIERLFVSGPLCGSSRDRNGIRSVRRGDGMNEPMASKTSEWETVVPGFRYALFERIDPEANAYRRYLLLWQPTLFGNGAVVRQFGRIGQDHRLLFTSFDSLSQAWPMIRRIVKTRLRHHYRLVVVGTESSSAIDRSRSPSFSQRRGPVTGDQFLT